MPARKKNPGYGIYSGDTEEQGIDYGQLNPGALLEIINDKEDNPPRDKRSRQYKAWKEELHILYLIYNNKVGAKIYKPS